LDKLNAIASNVLFIETPWSSQDSSVAKYAGGSMDSYSLKAIVEGLRKLGFKVEILYFVSYFPAPNERVMLKAKRNSV
jgi:pyruvate/2-oxoacid:ferredoxin oxidoreductase alpha subunit